VTVTAAGADRLGDLIRVHQREVVRFVRSRDDWEMMVRANPLAHDPTEGRRYLLAEDEAGGGPLAYVVVRLLRRQGDEARLAQVVEYAGDPGAVATLLASLLARPDVAAARVTVPADDVALNMVLRAAAPEPGSPLGIPSGVPNTIRLIDPAAFVHHLRLYLSERLGDERAASLAVTHGADGRFVVRAGEQTVTAPDRAALTWLMLGTHDQTRLSWLDGAPAALRVALDAVFPVPLPLPGLNYV
jgi:hypothetical protein